MNLNIFSPSSPLFRLRWFIMATLVIGGWLCYANLTGSRILSTSTQQQWSASGPGYHK